MKNKTNIYIHIYIYYTVMIIIQAVGIYYIGKYHSISWAVFLTIIVGCPEIVSIVCEYLNNKRNSKRRK